MSLKNLVEMKKLKIDKNIQELIEILWEHNYRTAQSCEGHNDNLAYLTIKENTGDGWFEKNSEKYGLRKIENGECCGLQQFSEIREFFNFKESHPNSKIRYFGSQSCGFCGAGMNGFIAYRGRLIPKKIVFTNIRLLLGKHFFHHLYSKLNEILH